MSFKKNLSAPNKELYFFVLEDLKAKSVIGTCGIFSDVGDEFYSFKVFREMASSELLGVRQENRYLQLVNDYKNVSELGLLLINKRFRKMGLGKFLSRSRYLFLADNLEKFHPHIIAEMRGKIDIWGRSVFWNGIGKKFSNITFSRADYLSASNQKHFIPDLFPHTPIPIAILPTAVQAVIGQPHPDTVGAVAVLKEEGFEYSHYVDIFDGGPTLEAVLKHVKTIERSKQARVSEILTGSGQQCMISHQSDHYRVCMGEIIVQEEGAVSVSSKLAASLRCQAGDTIRYVLL